MTTKAWFIELGQTDEAALALDEIAALEEAIALAIAALENYAIEPHTTDTEGGA